MIERIKRHIPICCYSPNGSGIRPVYKKSREEGRSVLVKVGETDQQALIESYRDECDINRLVERYQNGDASALARIQGLFTDISGIPTDSTDLLNIPIKANSIINETVSNENFEDNSQNNENIEEQEVNE